MQQILCNAVFVKICYGNRDLFWIYVDSASIIMFTDFLILIVRKTSSLTSEENFEERTNILPTIFLCDCYNSGHDWRHFNIGLRGLNLLKLNLPSGRIFPSTLSSV